MAGRSAEAGDERGGDWLWEDGCRTPGRDGEWQVLAGRAS